MPPYKNPETGNELRLVDFTIAALTHREQIKVWSVIVTIFGDLAQNPGDEISGPLLSSIMAPIGIRAEAMRVAIHRLRKDKWIESHKEGRISQYRLSAAAFAETKAVRPRIYGKSNTTRQRRRQDWNLTMLAPEGACKSLPLNQMEIASGIFLGKEPLASPPKDTLTIRFTDLAAPAWVDRAILPDPLRSAYEKFHGALAEIKQRLDNGPTPDRSEALIMRILIVHNWRRLLLRHSEVVDDFFPDGWIGNDCRSLVAAILERLPRPKLSELSPAAPQSMEAV